MYTLGFSTFIFIDFVMSDVNVERRFLFSFTKETFTIDNLPLLKRKTEHHPHYQHVPEMFPELRQPDSIPE